MGAPKGNQFWLARTSHGRKKKFTPTTFWKGCLEYFQWCEDNPLREEKVFHTDGKITHADVGKMRAMTMAGACTFLDTCEDTWERYRKDKDFSGVIKSAERIIKDQKFSGAAAGLLNPVIIARDLGLVEKKDIDTHFSISIGDKDADTL